MWEWAWDVVQVDEVLNLTLITTKKKKSKGAEPTIILHSAVKIFFELSFNDCVLFIFNSFIHSPVNTYSGPLCVRLDSTQGFNNE